MKQIKKIVFISHESSLSGAPILLLNFLKLLKELDRYKILLVIRKDGPLSSEFKKIVSTIILKSTDYGVEKTMFRKINNFLKNKFKLFNILMIACRYNLIFSNTIVNGKLINILKYLGKPVITYVHELEKVIDIYVNQKDGGYTFKFTKRFLFPSNQVRKILIEKFVVPPDKTFRLDYFLDINNSSNDYKKTKDAFSKTDPKTLIVAGMGSISFRKGFDIFVKVYEIIRKTNSDILFCWIGKSDQTDDIVELLNKIQKNSLYDNISILGELPHNSNNLKFCDFLFLSSREDPYPLVVLEAALLSKPTLCFKDSGGIIEFVEDDAGWLISNISSELAAKKILYLKENYLEITQKGKIAYNKVLERHTNKSKIVEQFFTAIDLL